MTKEIEHLIKISTLRDVQIKLIDAKLEGVVIPQVVFDIVKDLEEEYNKK